MKHVLLFLCLFTSTVQAKSKYILEAGGFIPLTDVVSPKMATEVIYSILSSDNDNLLMYINSPGGSVFSGLEIIETMKTSGKHFTCIANFAASMAFAILQACDERLVLKTSIIMQHQASYGLEGQANRNRNFVDFLEQSIRFLSIGQAKKIGLSLKEFEAKIADDWWMFGEAAISNNAADEVITVGCARALTKTIVTKEVSGGFFSFKYQTSACPLVKGPIETPKTAEKIKQLNLIK